MKNKFMIGFWVLVFVLIWALVSLYPDWLWFHNLAFSSIFWTIFFSKLGLGLAIWLILILLASLSLYVAKRLHRTLWSGAGSENRDDLFSQLGLSGKGFISVAFLLVISLMVASRGAAQWDLVLRYFYQQPFGDTDPLFHNDLGFYVFSYPFYLFAQKWLLVLVLLAAGITIYGYMKKGVIQIPTAFVEAEGKPISLPAIRIAQNAKKHLIFLGGIVALILAWGFYLKKFGLLYSIQGPAFGASYTDVHVMVLVYQVLAIASLGFALVLFFNALKFRTKLIALSGAVWIGAVVVLGTLLPMVVQKLVVKPNELAKESPYIDYNINYTRKAYNLNQIKEVNFQVSDRLSKQDLKRQDATIQNIRIWDERPLLQTYRQIQTIRLYYDFHNVDVDRYRINNQYRQVMLAARELVVKQLPAQANTWVNRHLIYTHGYGLASSPVNEVTREGLPRLFVKDLPPSFEPDLEIQRPEIYYGERTDEYVLVKTKTREFDYPKGDKNIYTIYQGSGGVPIKSFFRRLLFAFEFFDPQILFTTYLTPESRIMYNRRIDRRTRLVAPFLDYDRDPYLVVSGGRLYWILDAYTTSDMYPYSSRSYGILGNKRINYIRNSVKVTIDAYNGDVVFYIVDEKDPIVETYSRIFPNLFKAFEEMPADLKRHIRYPKDLFRIQVGTYTKYHMEDVQVFYNQEDLWQIPDELYGDSRQEMEPYYIIIKLPEEEKEEFLLMLPFTPSKKDNMIGWLAARSDLPNYGKLLVYKLPKEKLVYGPMQIEARVDQQTEISRELSLWGQRGSRVIRGNLLAIPLSDTFIYVEPIYLEAKQEGSEISSPGSAQPRGFAKPRRRGISSEPGRSAAAALPELKRVIVAFGNRLVMEQNLDRALVSVLGEELLPRPLPSASLPQARDISRLGALALEHYNRAKEHLRRGNWAGFGEELKNLEKILMEAAKVEREKR